AWLGRPGAISARHSAFSRGRSRGGSLRPAQADCPVLLWLLGLFGRATVSHAGRLRFHLPHLCGPVLRGCRACLQRTGHALAASSIGSRERLSDRRRLGFGFLPGHSHSEPFTWRNYLRYRPRPRSGLRTFSFRGDRGRRVRCKNKSSIYRARARAVELAIHAGRPSLHLARENDSRAKSNEGRPAWIANSTRSEEHTSELQSRGQIVCRPLLEKKQDIRDVPEIVTSLHE